MLANSTPRIALCIGTGYIGFVLVTAISTILSYVLDCYKDIAEKAIMGLLVVRAIIATGITFAVQPWLEEDWLKVTFGIMAAVAVVVLETAGLL
jgi:peptidoglycan biosynthesis protein MviN/MurJ (putative lipid II flippase)